MRKQKVAWPFLFEEHRPTPRTHRANSDQLIVALLTLWINYRNSLAGGSSYCGWRDLLWRQNLSRPTVAASHTSTADSRYHWWSHSCLPSPTFRRYNQLTHKQVALLYPTLAFLSGLNLELGLAFTRTKLEAASLKLPGKRIHWADIQTNIFYRLSLTWCFIYFLSSVLRLLDAFNFSELDQSVYLRK